MSTRESTEVVTTRESVRVDGRERTFMVAAPASGSAENALLFFHGSNQTAEITRAFAGRSFDTVAASGSTVVAYLDGYRRNWNDGRIRSEFPARREGVGDVAFARAVVAHLARTRGTRADRTFVAGFSSGASMVLRLLHDIPTELAGAGLISATLPVPENRMPAAAAAASVPVIAIHATKDPLVPYAGGMASLWGFRPRGLGESAPETAAYLAERNGISSAYVDTRISAADVRGGTWVERRDYREMGRDPVRLFTVHGGGHVIPNPKKAPRIMGRSTRELVAADEMGRFFGLLAN